MRVAKGRATRNGGRIINIASDAGRVGSTGEVVYSGCKGAPIAFAKALARELARNNVLINTICPGRPDDYAGLAAFLASEEAVFMTGQTISVSGGLTMHG